MSTDDARDAAPPTVRSVTRAIALLDALGRALGGLRLVDLARETDLSSATALRMLAVLEQRQLVEVDGTLYRLGPAVLGLAHGYLRTSPLVGRCRPVLQELAATTGLTASLYVRVGDERVIALRFDGLDPLRYQLPVGRRLPLDAGAGKTILAFLGDAEQRRILGMRDALEDASGRRVATDRLVADLAEIRRTGHHLSIGERAQGVAAISAPVRDARGAVEAAVSASGPAERFPPDVLVAFVPELLRAAHAVST